MNNFVVAKTPKRETSAGTHDYELKQSMRNHPAGKALVCSTCFKQGCNKPLFGMNVVNITTPSMGKTLTSHDFITLLNTAVAECEKQFNNGYSVHLEIGPLG